MHTVTSFQLKLCFPHGTGLGKIGSCALPGRCACAVGYPSLKRREPKNLPGFVEANPHFCLCVYTSLICKHRDKRGDPYRPTQQSNSCHLLCFHFSVCIDTAETFAHSFSAAILAYIDINPPKTAAGTKLYTTRGFSERCHRLWPETNENIQKKREKENKNKPGCCWMHAKIYFEKKKKKGWEIGTRRLLFSIFEGSAFKL